MWKYRAGGGWGEVGAGGRTSCFPYLLLYPVTDTVSVSEKDLIHEYEGDVVTSNKTKYKRETSGLESIIESFLASTMLV